MIIINKYYESDPSREALNYVYDKYKPVLWYFGHMHKYQQGKYENCKWVCLSAIGFGDQWYTKLECVK